MGSNLQSGQFYGQVRKQLRTGGVTLSEITHTSARKLPKHAHESVYVSMLLGGSYKETIGSRELESKPLDVVFHPACFEHKDEIGSAGARFFSLEISSKWLHRIAANSSLSQVAPGTLTGEGVLLMRRLLATYLRDADGTAHLEAESLTAELIGTLCPMPRDADGSRPSWLPRVEDYLRANFFQQLTLEDAALQADVHPVHLSRVFRRVHKQTMGDYLNKLRSEFVAKKLASDDISLADAALEAGFADQAHLTRVFKQLNGITPGALRRALQ